jgi:hypothetical protein
MRTEIDIKQSSPAFKREIDSESQTFLSTLMSEEQVRSHRIPGVRTVLVVLSAKGMVYDIESLRQKILLSYPDSTVFFLTTLGKPVGSLPPRQVDLLIDFTGSGQRQGWFYARKLRRMARVAVGRNAGLFRKRIYDKIFDEKSPDPALEKLAASDVLERERQVQKRILNLSGVAFVQYGDTPPDRGKSIALELPPMQRL